MTLQLILDENLSVPARSLVAMTNQTSIIDDRSASSSEVFADPVAYLAEHGIESELIAEDSLPAAA